MNTSRRSTRIEKARELHVRGQPLLKGKRMPTSYTILKAPNFEPEGDDTLIVRLSWSSRGHAFEELRATIDAEKAVFHRIISSVRKAVFGPGALSMSEADAFVEALQHYKSERAVALTTQAKE